MGGLSQWMSAGRHRATTPRARQRGEARLPTVARRRLGCRETRRWQAFRPERVQKARRKTGAPPWPSSTAARSKPASPRSRPRRGPPRVSTSATRPRRNRKAEWARRLVRGERAHRRRPDLAAVPGRRDEDARAGRLRCRASSGSRSTRRCATPSAPPSSRIPCLALFPYTDPEAARRGRQRGAQPGQPGLPRHPRDQEGGAARSACSATSRSIPIPATAMTGCCATASSSTTRPSRCWCSRRWSRRRPAATSSRPPT